MVVVDNAAEKPSEARFSDRYTPSRHLHLIRRHALWLLVCFCLALSYFAGNNLSQKIQDRYDARVIRVWTEASIDVNGLVHALQKERGFSSGFLASRGRQFGQQLVQQRQLTDDALARLEAHLQQIGSINGQLAGQIRKAMPEVLLLQRQRELIGYLALSQEAALAYYSQMIEELFDQLLATMSIGKAGWIYRQQLSFIFFLQTKEMAGQERALVTAILTSGDFGPTRMNAYNRIRAIESGRQERFEQLAEPEALDAFRAMLREPFVREADHVRRLIDAYGASDQKVTVHFPEPGNWFALATRKIESMTTFEERLSTRLIEGATSLEKQAETEFQINAVTVLVSFILAIVLVLQIRRGEKVAKENIHLAAAVFRASTESIVVTDPNGVIVEVNEAFTQITGYTRAEAMGQTPRICKSGRHDDHFYQKMWKTLLSEGRWEGEVWNRRKNGSIYPCFLSISTTREDNGSIRYLVGTALDLSNHKETEALLERIRTRDPLTGLPNREAWITALETRLADAREAGQPFAVITLGIDRFKRINDSINHVVGDKVLVAAAERIRNTLPQRALAARLEGDCFSVILFKQGDLQSVTAYCEQLVSAFVPVIEVGKHSFALSLSMGVALYPGDGQTVRELRRNSEVAMYRAKEEAQGSYAFYSEEMNARSASLLRMERMLRQALDNGEFAMVYQPQFSAADGRLVGVEALIRWHSPELGMVSPVQFIPIAEESGLINPIGEWVIRRSCEEIQALRVALGQDFTLAVNLSARQFRRADLMVMIRLILDATGFPCRLLEMEITEGVLMTDPLETTVLLDGFRQMGMRIALDDFGTGYSSLAYLKNFPIDRLKIDRAFVKDLPHNEQDQAIARTVIALGLNLGMEILAEGVETEAQASFLRAEGCGIFQGYLYGKPMPAAQLAALIRSGEYRI